MSLAMLIPRFSIRWLLALTGFCGLFSVVLAAGWRGEYWAAALAIAILALIFTLIVHAAIFCMAWLFSQVFARRLRAPRR